MWTAKGPKTLSRIGKYWHPCWLIAIYRSFLRVQTITCIWTRISVLIRLEASLSLPSPRWPLRESISSIKMMDGALSRAIWKRFDTSFSLSPIHFETRSEEETLQESSSWHLPTYWPKFMNTKQAKEKQHKQVKEIRKNKT